jgi:uncharacterized membrane protein
MTSGTRDPGTGNGDGGGRSGRAIARGLGWFSFALGVPQVVAPGRVARLVGLDDTGGTRLLLRAVGARELAAGLGIVSRPRPAGWLGARVAGDAMDLALLAAASRDGGNRTARVQAATAAVAGVTVLDVVATRRRAAASDRYAGGRLRATAGVTVDRPADDLYRSWRDIASLPTFMDHLRSVEVTGERTSHWVANAPAGRTVEWDAEIVEDRPGELIAWRSSDTATVRSSGTVRFTPAPGNRGTEVTVEMEYAPPGGAIGAVVAKLFGEEPVQQLKDDLRRFKQVAETGEVLRSDGTPDGSRTLRQVRQRSAQPSA